jgi:predicted DNA-binding ribbon-helix-helix protein
MCKIFSELNPGHYTYQTRSVRLGGHATSVRLEAAFWNVLEDIAASQGVTLGRFLSKLHDEVLEFRGETHNFSSLLRCACLTYVDEIKRAPEAVMLFTTQRHQRFIDDAGGGSDDQRPLSRVHAES